MSDLSNNNKDSYKNTKNKSSKKEEENVKEHSYEKKELVFSNPFQANSSKNKDSKPPEKDERGRVYLPYYKERLKKMIVKDPQKAWEMCKEDKYYAMVRRQALESLLSSPVFKENKNLKEFDMMGKAARDELLVKGISVMDNLGFALTVDLILEAWREDHQNQVNYFFGDRYVEMLTKMEKLAEDNIEETIVKDALKSISDIISYEKKVAKEHYEIIDRFIALIEENKILDKLSEEKGLFETIQAMFLTLSGNNELKLAFMGGLSKALSDFIQRHFDELEEKDKYIIALYPRVLSSLWTFTILTNEELEKEKEQQKLEKKERSTKTKEKSEEEKNSSNNDAVVN